MKQGTTLSGISLVKGNTHVSSIQQITMINYKQNGEIRKYLHEVFALSAVHAGLQWLSEEGRDTSALTYVEQVQVISH